MTELKEWLIGLGVTHVAMESTGVYWKSVLYIGVDYINQRMEAKRKSYLKKESEKLGTK